MFKQLCGDKALKHSIIVTTFWSNVEERDGLRREQELCADETLFKAFLDNGAQITRHDSGLVSAKEIMGDFIGMPRVVLQVQDELSRGIALKDTAAGQVVMEQIRQLQEKHRREMDDLREEMKEAAKRKNRDLMAELTRERDRVEKMMKKNQDKLDQPEPQAEEQVHKLSGVRAIGQGVTINPADAPISNFDKQIPEPKRRPPMGSKRARRNPLTRTASRRLHMIGKSPFKTSNRIKRDGATGGVSRRLNRILRTIRFRSRTRD
jgi:predicted RNA-binding protein with RPS1 domain